jgi:hypothetical protein
MATSDSNANPERRSDALDPNAKSVFALVARHNRKLSPKNRRFIAMRLFLPLALFSAVIPSLQAGVIGSDGIAAAHASSLKAATATVCVPGDDGEEETCRQASNPEQEEEAVSEASYQASYPATAAADGDDPLGSDIGLPQQLDAGHSRGILDVVAEARRYMTDVVAAEDRYSRVRDLCRNEHESCAFWALLGECDKNPGYMKVNCAPVCQSCEVRFAPPPPEPSFVNSTQPRDC